MASAKTFYGTGRRKSSVARVYVKAGKGTITVNERDVRSYFPHETLVLDLKQTTMLLAKSDDKNACFNYLIQLIVKRIVEEYKDVEKINLYLDNRSVKIGNRLSLKPYLYNKLVLEQLETKNNVKRIEFDINYFESESCYLIQWADIVANSLYKKYNSNNEKFYAKIKPYIVYENRFPSKKFGQ